MHIKIFKRRGRGFYFRKKILQLEQEKNDLFNQIKKLQEELTEKNNKKKTDNGKSIKILNQEY